MPFDQVSGISDHAVRKAAKVFASFGYEVEDVTNQHLDHDLVLRKGGESLKVEVKFDRHILKTGNVAAEWWDDEETQREGWVQTCHADAVVYFLDFDWAYVLDPQGLRQYVEDNYDRLEDGYVRQPDSVRDKATGKRRYKKTLNKLVPIQGIRHVRIRRLEEFFGTPEEPTIVGGKSRRARKRPRSATTQSTTLPLSDESPSEARTEGSCPPQGANSRG